MSHLKGKGRRDTTRNARIPTRACAIVRTIMDSLGNHPGLVNLPVPMRSAPASPGASISASAARHLLHRPARTEPDLDLRDLELVHAKAAKHAHQPFAEPVHAGRLAALAAVVNRPDSSRPNAAR